MFEKSHEELISRTKFFMRLLRGIIVGALFIVLALGAGMWGYHWCEKMPWTDAFVNAAMILSGMGPLSPLVTQAGKIFAGFYALFSGLAFILILGVMYGPFVHRFFHKFHLEENNKSKQK